MKPANSVEKNFKDTDSDQESEAAVGQYGQFNIPCPTNGR
jgi:hypothetical protein